MSPQRARNAWDGLDPSERAQRIAQAQQRLLNEARADTWDEATLTRTARATALQTLRQELAMQEPNP